ncbi:hypothetical protein AJ80_00494 [Polytolypa hystricis UAMH7299]|uniref:Very-long-chain 3-oxoacyl-CoA synthase n=1 Tax=Polytolypa hystricis (strain UAMH7299) TaxID=1447883 RepID=A0A2B7Z4E9_POLH7|nr:hypothetical protein AJ80_00494 [Polytolypa hystricis UAMH7299]
MDSLPQLLSSSITLITIAISLRIYVRRHGPIRFASKLTKINNYFYATASLFFCIAILSSSSFFTRKMNFESGLLLLFEASLVGDETRRKIYHLSKFYEYVDILNVLASGGQVGLHFGFHHLTLMSDFMAGGGKKTPYLTYFRVLHHHEGWTLVAGLNTLHHVFMYAYFGGMGFLRPILPMTGMFQLIVGIAGEIWIVCRNMNAAPEMQLWPHVACAGLLGTYLVLYIAEMKEMSQKDKVDKKKGGTGAHTD